ncbi:MULTISPECIES: ATP-binding protein [Erysipelotrichaceae]|uniref:AAA family ATPase n=1 Tax=Amedibacillus hominis TaxID=2897776 RepID=A0ABS9R2J1_9FIRM|nr:MULTISPECIES: AAA family ATPase [Erysipelotrichaceae]MCH4283878.1 AAA family ATPase [Amedibacillus hominis]
MLYRKISNDIMEWLHTGKKALLVSGTDRIGKTTIIQECLKSTHHSFIELNFKKQPELIELFEKATSTQDLLLRLSVVSKEPLIKGKTVIFFDEIQEFKDIMTRIKFLVDDGTYRFIMSGSLLGVELHNLRSAPVGYVEILDMFPLDFEEFLLANGIGENVIQKLKECFENRKPVDEFIHKKMLDIFYLYLIVGGMPEAVVNYIETNNIQNVSQTHKNIIHLYEQDFTKYEDKYRLMLKEIYTTMASELNKRNKRFKLNSVKTGISYDRIKNDFLWLKDAGVAYLFII